VVSYDLKQGVDKCREHIGFDGYLLKFAKDAMCIIEPLKYSFSCHLEGLSSVKVYCYSGGQESKSFGRILVVHEEVREWVTLLLPE
jgi:hypothetical protein